MRSLCVNLRRPRQRASASICVPPGFKRALTRCLEGDAELEPVGNDPEIERVGPGLDHDERQASPDDPFRDVRP